MPSGYIAGYTCIPDASLRGPCNLRLLGANRLLFIDGLVLPREVLDACASTCSSAVDCVAFVFHRNDRMCTFKSMGAEPESTCMLATKHGRDLYVRKQQPSAAAALDGAMQAHAGARSLTPQAGRLNESRVYSLPSLLRMEEAAALRDFATGCFQRARADTPARAIPTGRAIMSEVATLGSGTCKAAGDAAVTLARLERRIHRVTGLPAHASEEPLLLTRQRPSSSAPWLDGSQLHHDRINVAKARRDLTVLTYLDSVRAAAHGPQTCILSSPWRARSASSGATLRCYSARGR